MHHDHILELHDLTSILTSNLKYLTSTVEFLTSGVFNKGFCRFQKVPLVIRIHLIYIMHMFCKILIRPQNDLHDLYYDIQRPFSSFLHLRWHLFTIINQYPQSKAINSDRDHSHFLQSDLLL